MFHCAGGFSRVLVRTRSSAFGGNESSIERSLRNECLSGG